MDTQIMDTLCLYRTIGFVRDSLVTAGLEGFALFMVDRPYSWFDFAWLIDFIEGREHRTVPLAEGDRPSPEFETRNVYLQDRKRTVYRECREGVVYVLGDCLVTRISFLNDWGNVGHIVLGGERRSGAFQEFLDAYGDFEGRWTRTTGKIEVIGGSPVPRPADLTWDDVILPTAMRADLRLQVDSFFSAGELYRKLGIPYRRGLLFTGPPGNGKTSVLRVIAAQRPEPFIWLAAKKDEDGENLDVALDRALVLAPSILCFEDIDSLLRLGDGLSHFLNRLDGLGSLEGVLIVATTNHPEELDEAVTNRPSRFDRIFYFDNPAAPERRAYLAKQFGSRFDERLVGRSGGLSFAQLKEAWVTACLEAVHAGLGDPDPAEALRSFDRMLGRRGPVTGEWSPDRPVGFQRPIVSNSREPQ